MELIGLVVEQLLEVLNLQHLQLLICQLWRLDVHNQLSRNVIQRLEEGLELLVVLFNFASKDLLVAVLGLVLGFGLLLVPLSLWPLSLIFYF